jgi:hypothetical protein
MPTDRWWEEGACEECPALEIGDRFDHCHLKPPTPTDQEDYYPIIKNKETGWCIQGRRLMQEIRLLESTATLDARISEQFEKMGEKK